MQVRFLNGAGGEKKPNYFGIQCWYKSDSHHGKD